ncbi:hypothetical protein Plhal304r1_c048g0129971 [Plasmopara halstedii]
MTLTISCRTQMYLYFRRVFHTASAAEDNWDHCLGFSRTPCCHTTQTISRSTQDEYAFCKCSHSRLNIDSSAP